MFGPITSDAVHSKAVVLLMFVSLFIVVSNVFHCLLLFPMFVGLL